MQVRMGPPITATRRERKAAMSNVRNHSRIAGKAPAMSGANQSTAPTQSLTAEHAQTDGATVEQLLQASRRLDWRFLLPNPALARVAYDGPKQGALFAALRLFAEELTVLPASGSAAQATRYDVVVLCEPTPRTLQQAVHLVRPGGVLYSEVHGPLWPAKWLRRNPLTLFQQPRLWQPTDYVQALTQAGFAEAHAFWFWPDFDHCTKIIPLADAVVLPYVFAPSTQPRGVKGRLKAAYKQWLVQSGWLTVTQPSFGIVAY